ncbi:MAG: Rpp14/Pop5 family protein [Candidatus Nanoarchaeia archaeon]|nr:Rpp14/Pop5 family protein [Candidatus Nanoarchaeia archaeon]
MTVKAMAPSMREKKRYIAFEAAAEKPLPRDAVVREIRESMNSLIGTLGMAKAGLIFLPDWENNKGVLRISHKYTDIAKSAIALVKQINGTNVIIKSITISGILKKSRNKIGGR